MADDTLSPVDFSSRIVKTNLGGQERYAMACLFRETQHEELRAAFIRRVLLTGMEALGWDEPRMVKEYAAYRLRCIERSVANPFESE